MSNESEKAVRQSEPKPPGARLTLAAVTGAVVIGLIGIGFLGTIMCALLFGQFLALGVCLCAITISWLLTKTVQKASLRILLRSLAFGLFLWPFIPHKSTEWSSPWPPAGYWVFLDLQTGRLRDSGFELFSFLVGTAVIWWAGLAVHRYRHRHEAA